MVFFGVTQVFHQLSRAGLVGKAGPISALKILRCRKNFFQKLSQFSQGINVLDTLASNTDGFLSKYECVPSPRLNKNNLEQREPITTLNNLRCRKYSFHKLT
jgi:hypothetical protein